LIKAVVFDFGGVLVRTEDQSGRIKWEQRLKLSPGDLSNTVFDSNEARQATLGQLPASAVWEHVAHTYALSQVDLDDLRQDFFAGDCIDQNLVDFLSRLRPQYKTAILSNAFSDGRAVIATTYRLEWVVDQIIISAEEKLAKPDPAFYLLACSRLGVSPREMVFGDDFPQNVAGALSVGIRAYLYKNTQTLLSVLNLVI